MIICMKNVCSILVDANTIVIEIVIAIPANMISLLNDSNEMTFFCKNSSNRSARYTLKTVESTLSQIRRRRARGTSGLWPSSP